MVWIVDIHFSDQTLFSNWIMRSHRISLQFNITTDPASSLPCVYKWAPDGMCSAYSILLMYHRKIILQKDSGHNGHKPKRPKPKRPQTETATNRNGHRPKRPQTETATNRKGHRPEWPQTGTATNRNGHKPERPQIEIDTTISDSAGYKCMCSIEVSN